MDIQRHITTLEIEIRIQHFPLTTFCTCIQSKSGEAKECACLRISKWEWHCAHSLAIFTLGYIEIHANVTHAHTMMMVVSADGKKWFTLCCESKNAKTTNDDNNDRTHMKKNWYKRKHKLDDTKGKRTKEGHRLTWKIQMIYTNKRTHIHSKIHVEMYYNPSWITLLAVYLSLNMQTWATRWRYQFSLSLHRFIVVPCALRWPGITFGYFSHWKIWLVWLELSLVWKLCSSLIFIDDDDDVQLEVPLLSQLVYSTYVHTFYRFFVLSTVANLPFADA